MAVVLESERVFLRELLLNDVEPLTAVVDTLGESPRAFVAAQQASYRAHGFGVWAAVHREAGMVLGYAGLRPREEAADADGNGNGNGNGNENENENENEEDAATAELWCLIEPPYRGNGLGEEIARALLGHAFETLQRRRVVATLNAEDEAARRFAEKLGLELETELGGPARRLYAVARASS